jgi:general L-amino acid transport system substrate-binding protein
MWSSTVSDRRRAVSLLLFCSVIALALAACGSNSTQPTTKTTTNAGGETLGKVKARGVLRVGVNDQLPGFGFIRPDGGFGGFDVDFGRALAAAVFGDANKVEIVPVSATSRFEALAAGEIDVLIRNATWSLSRDTTLNISFTVPTFYDGQGIMVSTADRIKGLQDLNGAVVCALASTTTQLNSEDTFAGTNVRYKSLVFDRAETLQDAFIAGRCDAWTSDRSQLAARKAAFPERAGGSAALEILPITLSREPLAPAVRQSDAQWADLVNWVVIGMILADDIDVTSQNVDAQVEAPSSPEAARLLGVSAGGSAFDPGLGLPPSFMRAVIKQVGNYGEVYDRNLTPLGIPRDNTPNHTWRKGGLLYAPPWR